MRFFVKKSKIYKETATRWELIEISPGVDNQYHLAEYMLSYTSHYEF